MIIPHRTKKRENKKQQGQLKTELSFGQSGGVQRGCTCLLDLLQNTFRYNDLKAYREERDYIPTIWLIIRPTHMAQAPPG